MTRHETVLSAYLGVSAGAGAGASSNTLPGQGLSTRTKTTKTVIGGDARRMREGYYENTIDLQNTKWFTVAGKSEWDDEE